jgi:hypothetical protein
MNYSKNDLMCGRLLDAYTRAINKIDDYFEYQCESSQDQAEVYRILKQLTDEIEQLTAKP